LSAIGTLDAHASGKLTGSKLDSAVAGLTAEYAARGKLRKFSPEQENSLKLKVLEAQACFACPLAEFLVSGPFHEHADVVCYVRSCRTQSIGAGPCHIVLCCAVLCCAVLCCAVPCCAADHTLYDLFKANLQMCYHHGDKSEGQDCRMLHA